MARGAIAAVVVPPILTAIGGWLVVQDQGETHRLELELASEERVATMLQLSTDISKAIQLERNHCDEKIALIRSQ